jgi:hypothetical protein
LILTPLETVIKFQIATKYLICSDYEFCKWNFENNATETSNYKYIYLKWITITLADQPYL